jgi:hypothetical protein
MLIECKRSRRVIKMANMNKRRGFVGRSRALWSEREDSLVRTYYPDYTELLRKLPRRTPQAVRSRVFTLDLPRTRKIYWTAAEISKLRRLYPRADRQTILTAFPSASWSRIQSAASRQHIVRKRRRSTGHQLLDVIRARCDELNYSMVDLDALARTRRYFRRCGWSCRKASVTKIAKAIQALGGTITVSWND